jgi:hypothetical protein
MLLRDVDGTIAGVGIGTIPHPAVVFAFVDGAAFVQHGYRPSSVRPDRRSSFRHRRHLAAPFAGRNP